MRWGALSRRPDPRAQIDGTLPRRPASLRRHTREAARDGTQVADVSRSRCSKYDQWNIIEPMRSSFAILLIFGSMSAAFADDDCPRNFQNYGIFLQAQKSCGRKVEYPFMKIMKACARETSEPKAIELMDAGRRIWAKNLMRSSLGTMCEEVLSRLPVPPNHRKR